jgi:hypothetical protein
MTGSYDDYGNQITGPPPDYTGRQDKTARGSGLDIFKAAFPDHATLEQWARDGLAYTLQSGRIVPGATAPQVNDCIQRCKGSLGHGGVEWPRPGDRAGGQQPGQGPGREHGHQ